MFCDLFCRKSYTSAAPMSPLVRKWLDEGKGGLLMQAIIEHRDTVVIDGVGYRISSSASDGPPQVR